MDASRALQQVAELCGAPQPKQAGHSLLPLAVQLPREGDDLREELLWRLGDSALQPQVAAVQFCSKHSIPRDYAHGMVEPQIRRALAQAEQQDGAAPGTVEVQVHVELGHKTVKDSLHWRLDDRPGSVDAYAAALCRDYGLDWQFFEAIKATINQQLAARQGAAEPAVPAAAQRDGPELIDLSPNQQLQPSALDGGAAAPDTMGHHLLDISVTEDATEVTPSGMQEEGDDEAAAPTGGGGGWGGWTDL